MLILDLFSAHSHHDKLVLCFDDFESVVVHSLLGQRLNMTASKPYLIAFIANVFAVVDEFIVIGKHIVIFWLVFDKYISLLSPVLDFFLKLL